MAPNVALLRLIPIESITYTKTRMRLINSSEVVVWGTGNAMREFLYVDDMAAALLFVLELDEEIYQTNTRPMLSHY